MHSCACPPGLLHIFGGLRFCSLLSEGVAPPPKKNHDVLDHILEKEDAPRSFAFFIVTAHSDFLTQFPQKTKIFQLEMLKLKCPRAARTLLNLFFHSKLCGQSIKTVAPNLYPSFCFFFWNFLPGIFSQAPPRVFFPSGHYNFPLADPDKK